MQSSSAAVALQSEREILAHYINEKTPTSAACSEVVVVMTALSVHLGVSCPLSPYHRKF